MFIFGHSPLLEGLYQVILSQQFFKFINEDSFHFLLILGKAGEIVGKIDPTAASVFVFICDNEVLYKFLVIIEVDSIFG